MLHEVSEKDDLGKEFVSIQNFVPFFLFSFYFLLLLLLFLTSLYFSESMKRWNEFFFFSHYICLHMPYITMPRIAIHRIVLFVVVCDRDMALFLFSSSQFIHVLESFCFAYVIFIVDFVFFVRLPFDPMKP